MRVNKPKSSVIYSGPSLIDGKPIVCIAIVGSSNRKTSDLLQTYIIRSDMSPMEASKSGEDVSICGTCIHRGTPTNDPTKKQAIGRSCYVTLFHGPSVVYKAFKRGGYGQVSLEGASRIGAGRMVRLGSYGDPSAVPNAVWDAVLRDSIGHTGYTHRHNANTDYSRLMHSADTAEEAITAHAKGNRTFRVIPVKVWEDKQKESLLANEILCPASNEAGNRVTCLDCKLCTGSGIKAKSIAIVSHGTGRNMLQGASV